MTAFTITVEGEPKGKQRARHGMGRTFTPRDTVLAEQEIRRAWEEAGKPRLADGPVIVEVQINVVRPQSHTTAKGLMSTEGKRHGLPFRKKPDIDNALKLVMDALNTRAWRDDVQVVEATVWREWQDTPSTVISAREAG